MCIDNSIYQETYEILKTIKVKKTSNRPNASGLKKLVQWGRNKNTDKYDKVGYPCKSMNFGIVKKRFCNNGNAKYKFDNPIQEGNNNSKYPEVYNQLKKLIHTIDPNFEYDCITINHNFLCKPHYDKNNKSPSIIIGLGNYEGGELVIENCEFDIKNNALMFNGSTSRHWTNNYIGDRYSVIYFKIT